MIYICVIKIVLFWQRILIYVEVVNVEYSCYRDWGKFFDILWFFQFYLVFCRYVFFEFMKKRDKR